MGDKAFKDTGNGVILRPHISCPSVVQCPL